jgi:predicted transcriptional regulator
MEKKLTKIELFEKAIAETSDKVLKEFFIHEIELLNKRKSNKKSNDENEGYKEIILDVLSVADKPLTITDIMKSDSALPQSNQKISALVRQLKEAEMVVRTEVKGRAYFSLAETDEEEA